MKKVVRKQPLKGSIDSNQLLALCQRMRESMTDLDKSIRLMQLRLTTLSYIQDDVEAMWLKCLDHLLELCQQSQLVVRLLDELRIKLAESSESSILYQIASQQLMYFTSEWYDHFAPKLNETFEFASKQDIELESRVEQNGTGNRVDGLACDARVRDALLRLKQSMGENERLIVGIASNIEYTRTTIDTIYDSLQSTKLELASGEKHAIEAVGEIRQSDRRKILGYGLILAVLLVAAIILYRLLLR